MADAADAYSAIDITAYAALSGAIVGAGVVQHAVENTPMPVVIIGDQDEGLKLGGKGARPDRNVLVSITVVTEGEERLPCSALLGQVERILDDQTLATPGWRVTYYFKDSAAVLTEDGRGYVGMAQFNVFAIAA